MAGALEGEIFIGALKFPSKLSVYFRFNSLGPKAQEFRGLLSLRYPMEHSIVTDWNDMERVWQYIYSNDQLKVSSAFHSQ